ncbi:hypothetical protein AYO47_04065 [Planctomyces sp. SCGC AG-212-M04]|nr:hypothetical protein AYO47_04065 [Planctomyces sp. SCGC AG-212-M04]
MTQPATSRTTTRRLTPVIALAVTLCTTAAFACNVPVFRYALEHWNPDAYRGVVFHRGPLPESLQKKLKTFLPGSPDSPANLSIRTVDLDANPESADKELAASLKDAPLPQLVIRYPARHQIDAVLWKGAADDASLTSLLESPARQELLKRLLAGQTAVWVLIATGNATQDDAAELALEEELANLKKTLKLPERTDSPEDAIGDGPELRVEFSVLRIAKDDAKEQPLVAMLMNAESDLAELNEPLVFPVFGRLRALLPLVGPGISADNIRGSARFLAGACSCQVKEQNPGFDLLVAGNWNELIPWAKSPVNAVDALASPKTPELIPIAAGATPAKSATTAVEKAEPAVEVTPPPTPASATTPPAVQVPPMAPGSAVSVSPKRIVVIAVALVLLVGGFLVTRR